MNTYIVKFLEGTELQVAYIQGENQAKAKEEFLVVCPNIEIGKIISVIDINEQGNDYSVAIKVAKFTSFLGWVAVVVGILLSLSVVLITTGVSTVISGIMLIAGGQITRATADSANYSKQMLEETRNRK